MALLSGNGCKVDPAVGPPGSGLDLCLAFTLARRRAGEQRERDVRSGHRGDEDVSHLTSYVFAMRFWNRTNRATPEPA